MRKETVVCRFCDLFKLSTRVLIASFILSTSLASLDAWGAISDESFDEAALDASFYVATDGSDAWSGRLARPNEDGTDGPFATLERAQKAVRELKSANASSEKALVVEVAGGEYELNGTLTFTTEDGGVDKAAPVVWRGKSGETVCLNAGKRLQGVKKLEDASVLARIKPEARDKIVVVDLNGQVDVKDLRTAADGPELFFQGAPTTVARYPNEGFVNISELQRDGTNEVDIRGTKGIKEGAFYYDDEELDRCADENDLWAHGYWFWDWATSKQPVASIDVANNLMKLKEPWHVYGYRVGQWFYLFNALCELDAPGEYYIDREKNLLYFYPTSDEWTDADFLLTRFGAVVKLQNVSNFVFSGFQLCGACGSGVFGADSYLRNVVVQKCDVFNVGGGGISLNGDNCLVSECELWNLGSGGISMSGGNRDSLTPCNSRVVQNYVHDYARIQRVYATGVSVNGVGVYAGHNTIENAPHMGMGFGGNDILLEYNEVSNVCLESNDAGAIYTGRNWTMRGNVLQYNYLHDINGFRNNGCVGMYLDDMFSSAEMSHNLYVNVTRAAFIGGGRDCKINDNVFVNCKPALHIDARGDGWARDHVQGWLDEAKAKGTISGIKYKEPPYSTRYPDLASMLDEGKRPALPEGNEVSGNICVGGTWDVNKQGQWQGGTIEEKARPLLKMERNQVFDADDGTIFVDSSKGDYRLKEDSELVKSGYRSLPIDQMGVTTARMKARVAARRAK